MANSEHSATLVTKTVDDLVLANKILTVESVLDVYGHVSVRHPLEPERFLMSQDRVPVLVSNEDVAAYGMDGEPVERAASYLERYIHASIYASRPDVNAVCHNHALAVLPFCVATEVRLDIVTTTGSTLEAAPPVWDIADEFGDRTDVLVTDMTRAASLTRSLGGGTAVLMRSHGSTVVGASLREMVLRCYELVRNAQTLTNARSLGGKIARLADTEIEQTRSVAASRSYERQWRYLEWRAHHAGL